MDVSKIHTPMVHTQGVKKLDAGDGTGSPEHFLSLLGPLKNEEDAAKKNRKRSNSLVPGQNMPKTGPALAPPPPRPLYPDEPHLEDEHPGMNLDKRA